MKPIALALAGLLLLPAAALAQPTARLDGAALDNLFGRSPKVEVNLAGPMLRMALDSGVTDDADTAELLRGLRGITVRVYSMSDALSGLSDRITDYGQSLEASGWSTIVRVRPSAEDSDDVWVYVRDDGSDAFAGMTVMALDYEDDEAAFVLIDGRIDPSQIGSITGSFGFDMDDIEDAADDARDAAEDARDAAEDAREDMEDAREDIQEARAELEEARREAAQARAEAQAAREEAARIRAGVRP